ncbi:PP2C family protein-serine/threonine phosphatase [Streptacidiphilus sp. P02-A3a]|uniref:PP2C family protein-serine/threonine phosphatase n=1 Tax=Streptacidiphilus sp. P02-A3a TaxID=2704468 RepID=UPI0015F8EFE3|nr:PP2C family protein-serine/threonine phosphatase [Streptacidiphilus sp. P02-A3a]QMU71042.1 serine/threonine-protein phosphatase [Streptacidiphilus sp. P02-A3a]
MAKRRDPAAPRPRPSLLGRCLPGPFPRMAWLPLALLALIATADILSPADIHLGPLLVVAPAITASFAGPRFTAFIGALSVLTLVVIGLERGVIATENLEVQLAGLVVLSVLVVVFNRVHQRSKHELTRVRAVSEAAQRVLQSPLPERIGPLRIASSYRAVAAHARVGGDLFAAARTGDSTRLIIGDVRGKGLQTLGDTALLLGAFRAAAHQQSPLPGLAAYLEGSVSWGLAEPDGGAGPEVGEGFVTAVIVDIRDDEPLLNVVNCGHPPPLLLRGGRSATLEVLRPAPPLGLGTLGGFVADGYRATAFAFEPGDLLLLYTDGISEARDYRGEFYPLSARLERFGGVEPERLLARVNDDLDSFVGGPLADDAAMVAIARDDHGLRLAARPR